MKNLIYYTIVGLFLFISCKKDEIQPSDPNLFVPPTVSRTIAQITLVDEMTFEDVNLNANLELDFYRNTAYAAGLSTLSNPEYYTFMVINPNNNPNASAPLWVYLHGGSQGYFDDQGAYQSYSTVDEHRYNHEESFDDLWQNITVRIFPNGQLVDNTIKRRIQEGYRILVVSYSDHDWYSGLGTNYPNNPANFNAQVNGLQGTMAAIDYTAANYPTTHAWLHGTSAGSMGAWSTAISYQQEGRPVAGLIGDSGAFIENTDAIFDTYLESGQLNYSASWRLEGIQEKVGYFSILENQAHPKAQINTYDFRASAGLWLVGLADQAFAANLGPVQEAIDAGFDNNPEYMMSGLNQAINEQPGSPHELHFLPNTGHVPTHKEGPANDLVDSFIDRVLATYPPQFGM
ncbi:hypothetical protein N9D46_03080 [Chitinophagales bacterium]|mgnify:CR=1 FL=1|nr:hypothetical protein [Chitinophagales bacterium]MDC3209519.1 hypothetical protein [Chitinophagales bacterium]|tara:strand:- start:126 stop:1331 length:1206 start_codon:yes stop_codon:yes gene_type:complete